MADTHKTAPAARVPLTRENIDKCMCDRCPIQSKSRCALRLEPGVEAASRLSPIPPEAIPGMYCAGGKAHCPDLDFRNACVCGTCAIFNEDYHLADDRPSGYFCKGGMAT